MAVPLLFPKISSAQTVSLNSSGPENINIGDSLSINLDVTNVENFTNVNTDISYNSEILEYDHTEASNFFSQTGCLFRATPISPGILNIYADCFGFGEINGNHTAATIYFKAKNEGTTELKFLNNSIFNRDHNAISADWASKVMTIGGAIAESSPTLYFNLAPNTTFKGSKYGTTLTLGNVSKITSVAVEILYDGTKLEYDHSDASDFFKQEGCLFLDLAENNTITILADCSDVGAIDGTNPIATLYFNAIEKGNTELNINDALIVDNTLNEVMTKWDKISLLINESDTTAPQISEILPSNTLPLNTAQTLLSFKTDENAVCKYSNAPKTPYNEMSSAFLSTEGKNHSTEISGLENGSSYNYYVKCKDDNNNITEDINITFSVADPIEAEVLLPKILDKGSSKGKLPEGTKTANLFISTDKESACRYGTKENMSYDEMNSTFENTGGNNHSSLVNNLDMDKNYQYYIKCRDKEGNTSENLAVSFSTVDIKNNNNSVIIPRNKTQERIGSPDIKNTIASSTTIKEGNNKSTVEQDIDSIREKEAEEIFTISQYVNMGETEKKIYNKVMSEWNQKDNIDKNVKYSIAGFIQYGTESTKRLGAGERGSVLISYIDIFHKLPQTESDWQDIIKIANGKWPFEQSQEREKSTYDNFKKIYLREPNTKNINDKTAITLMAYSLRPSERNINTEKEAIKIFLNIYKYMPKSSKDWDIVRAIAYSGATR